MDTATISRFDALAAAKALRAAGKNRCAQRLERAALRFWTFAGYPTSQGHTRFLQEDGTFGSAANARLFTDKEKSAFDPASIANDEGGLLALDRWRQAPDETDIFDMQYSADPDVVDDYVTLVERATDRRGAIRLNAAA